MTRDDIIRAAYKVWGRDLYRTTSLTDIAKELGVSKPALYRHFKGKDSLLDAMYTTFFDDCSGFTRKGYEKAIKTGDKRKSYLIWLRTMSEFYALNKDAFIFSLTMVFSSRDRLSLHSEFINRGIDFGHPALIDEIPAPYPSKMQLGIATGIFHLAQFHHHEKKKDASPTSDQIKHTISELEKIVTRGLNMNAGKVRGLNYQDLEKQAAGAEYVDTETNIILRAAAEAVAEAGPWNASMEMVAKHSGLSKSGLYAHYKNKQDMLTKLFIAEFTRIVNFAKAQIERSSVSEEQLYLAIISMVNYLRSRPEILVALDWIKTSRLELGTDVSLYLYKAIGTIKIKAIQNYDRDMLVKVAQWMLFLIVNTLALWQPGGGKKTECPVPGIPGIQNQDISWARNAAEIPNESLRILFRYIALGVEGLNL